MRTSRLLFSLLFTFLLALNLNAQKIKVKKQTITIDKVEVGKLTKNEKGSIFKYNLATLEGESVLDLNMKLEVVNENKSFRWLELKQPNKDLINEIDFKFLSFTLNTEKGIVEFLLKNLNFVTTTGLDKEKINAFFSEKRTRESLEEVQKLKEGQELTEAQFNNVKPEVKSNFIIVSNAKIDEETNEPAVIGKVDVQQSEDNRIYTFSNLFGQKVAVAETKFKRIEALSKYFVLGYKDLSSDKVIEANNILKKIFNVDELSHAFPYEELAEQVLEAKKEDDKKAYSDAKAASKNIYKKLGYVIDDKGEKIEGDISMVFEKIDAKDPNEWGNVVDLNEANIGKSVSIRYKNKKGKLRTASFRSKKGVEFCLENNKKRCFKGMAAKVKGLELAAGGISSLSFDTSKFYELVKKHENIDVYSDIQYDRFLIKISSENKALQFNTNKEEKNIENVKEYLGKCYSDDFAAFNYSNKSDILKLAETYSNCSK